jgi:hypothetical protein
MIKIKCDCGWKGKQDDLLIMSDFNHFYSYNYYYICPKCKNQIGRN